MKITNTTCDEWIERWLKQGGKRFLETHVGSQSKGLVLDQLRVAWLAGYVTHEKESLEGS